MNPLTNIRNQNKLNERELQLGIAGDGNKSWHQKYSSSAWIYVGGLPYELNEGDLLAVFSQYGEIVNINLVRDHKTGKSRGFGFICYEDQRSTILAVDNFNGIKLLKRTIRVDHVEEYKIPKYREGLDPETLRLWEEGCAPKPIKVSVKETDSNEDDVDPLAALKRAGKIDEDGLLQLDKGVEKRMKKELKRARKEAKRERKRRKKEMKIKMEDGLDGIDIDGENESWKKQPKLIDKGAVDADDLYNKNEHFNFGKPKKEIPLPPTHNLRPDFEKADWREIEIYKTVKEKERLEKGEKVSNWKEEEHYLPKRFHRDE
uniref:RRM domain-containing protein n=1 Tax=Syphacia muris TaxID=451379 RepID=A0A0N5A9B3_9BILA